MKAIKITEKRDYFVDYYYMDAIVEKRYQRQGR